MFSFDNIRVIPYALLLLGLHSGFALAENFKGYRTTTLDAVIDEWNGKTKDEDPGISFSRPEKIKFVANMREAPAPCSTALLATVLKMMNFSDLLKQVKINHCVGFTSTNGRSVVTFVQDALVPGLKSDAKIGRPVDIYADFLAYQVSADRLRNQPIMLINRFEPR
jgi:hypothetical protein